MSENQDRVFRKNLADLGRLLAPSQSTNLLQVSLKQSIRVLEDKFADADIARLRIKTRSNEMLEMFLDAFMGVRRPGDVDRLRAYMRDGTKEFTSLFIIEFIAKEQQRAESQSARGREKKQLREAAFCATTRYNRNCNAPILICALCGKRHPAMRCRKLLDSAKPATLMRTAGMCPYCGRHRHEPRCGLRASQECTICASRGEHHTVLHESDSD